MGWEKGEFIIEVDCISDEMIIKERVVRCRDCKRCMAYMAGTYCDYMAHSVEPDGFCAWGQRAWGEDKDG